MNGRFVPENGDQPWQQATSCRRSHVLLRVSAYADIGHSELIEIFDQARGQRRHSRAKLLVRICPP